MTYCCDLPNGIRLYLDNQGDQTIVILLMQQVGQQQQSANRFTTGQWQTPPQIFGTAAGIVVQIAGAIGELSLLVQGMAMQQSAAIDLATATPIGVMPIEALPPGLTMAPMQPMAPMQMAPMQMAPMQMSPMQMSPMVMQMGNMAMSMAAPAVLPTTIPPSPAAAPANPATAAKFCSQCGTAVKPTDRFCASCGSSLG
jgi:zinc-ribbon domain